MNNVIDSIIKKMQIKQSTVFILVLLTAMLQSCGTSEHVVSDSIYNDAANWYHNGRQVDKKLVDVFYVLPTVSFDWKDENGKVQHYASLTDPQQREAMQPSYELADAIFADNANFFAPYYRHITLDSWMEGEDVVKERFPKAMDDIRAAFRHYMDNDNGGRPFILAGFSQGGKCVVELVKSLTKKEASRFVAAYVCGYRVVAEDVVGAPYLKPAQSATDTGVTIVYNTVTNPSAECGVVSHGNIYTINPASWTTDNDYHQLNDEVSLRIDPESKLIVAKGIDAEANFVPMLERLFVKGNLHLQELTLYQDVLRKNVKERINAFSSGRK